MNTGFERSRPASLMLKGEAPFALFFVELRTHDYQRRLFSEVLTGDELKRFWRGQGISSTA